MLSESEKDFFAHATQNGFLKTPKKNKGNIVLLTCGEDKRFPHIYAHQRGMCDRVHVMALPGILLWFADRYSERGVRLREELSWLLDRVLEWTGFGTIVPVGHWPCRMAKEMRLTCEENVCRTASAGDFLMRSYADRCAIMTEFHWDDGKHMSLHGMDIYHRDLTALMGEPLQGDLLEK